MDWGAAAEAMKVVGSGTDLGHSEVPQMEQMEGGRSQAQLPGSWPEGLGGR